MRLKLLLDLQYRERACGELKFACRGGFGRNRVLIEENWRIGEHLLLLEGEVWY